jgi:site-specific recombinase XerD
MQNNSDVLEQYRRELSTVQGAASNTVKTYLRELESLVKFLDTKSLTLMDATRETFMDWRESMLTRKPSGIALALAACRSLYSFLDESGILSPSPFPDRFKVKVKRQEPTAVPTAAQFITMRTLLDREPFDTRALDGLTRRAIVESLAGSGLRIEALLTLKAAHIRLDELRPMILVDAATMSCKGGLAGQIPLSPYAAGILRQYIKAHPVDPGKPLFPVSQSVIRKILHEIAPAGLNLKPHSLRHFYISMSYFMDFSGNRFDVVSCRDSAGHSNIAITNRYLSIAKSICQGDAEWKEWAYGPKEQRAKKTA